MEGAPRVRIKFSLILVIIGLVVALGANLMACSSPTPPPQIETDVNCSETNPHPVGQSIAGKFDVTYAEVMTWFCSGQTFDDILLALQTSELADRPVEELLEMKDQVGWEQVWEELGLVPETT